MSSVLGLVGGVVLLVLFQMWASRRYGSTDLIGVLIIKCRRSRWLKFLAYPIGGEDCGYIERLAQIVR